MYTIHKLHLLPTHVYTLVADYQSSPTTLLQVTLTIISKILYIYSYRGVGRTFEVVRPMDGNRRALRARTIFDNEFHNNLMSNA